MSDSSDSPYRTPTRAVDVELSITGGRTEEIEVEVTLYLSTLSETHAGPETVEEALNSGRHFLPVRLRETDQTILVRLGAIRTVTVGDDDGDVLPREESLASVDLVRLELDGGETIEGTLQTVLPPERPRLSDYFNFSKMKFVPLAVDEGVVYVNRDFISIVRFLTTGKGES